VFAKASDNIHLLLQFSLRAPILCDFLAGQASSIGSWMLSSQHCAYLADNKIILEYTSIMLLIFFSFLLILKTV
jgi:hypothetical protein